MNKQEMLDWRTQQDMGISQNKGYKRKLKKRREIEDIEITKMAEMSDVEQLEAEIDSMLGEVA